MNKRIACVFLALICFAFSFSMMSCHSHNLVTVEESAPTCTQAGYRKMQCEECNQIVEEEIPALDHDYTETVVSTPTCKSSGKSTFKCSRCGDTYTKTTEKIDHNYDSKTKRCTMCGQYKEGSVTGSYSGTYSWAKGCSKCRITSMDYVKYSNGLLLTFSVRKTYDLDGEYGTTPIGFAVIIKNSKGNVVCTEKAYYMHIVQGQSVKIEVKCIFDFDSTEDYRVTISDY